MRSVTNVYGGLQYLFRCVVFAAFHCTAFASPPGSLILKSPDGRIRVDVMAGKLQFTYKVSVDGIPVINPSKLGMELAGNVTLGSHTAVVSASHTTSNSTWNNPLGKSAIVSNNYNELRCRLQEDNGTRAIFEVVFRAFNDGVAFRYVIPKQQALDSFTVQKEQTGFSFAGDYDAYIGHHPAYTFRGSQEWEFNPARLSTIPADSVVGLPLLVKTPVAWVAITEADLLNWAGMWLTGTKGAGTGKNVTLVTALAPRSDNQGLVKAGAPQNSPWRVLMIGRKPGDLVESNIILNLSTPSEIGDAAWVHPGLMAWDHWWTGDVLMNTATEKQYIQLAADMGWPYQLVDWQWYGTFNKPTSDITSVAPAVDMNELLRFAKEKNVRLWVWLYWADVERNDAYKKAFALYEKWGLAGIKIDFMDRDDQDMVNWYEKIAKAAAEHHLMVDFHGAFKPTGLERTYPNQVTREGIMGNEYNRWSRRVTSEHKLTLPFTRLLTGPADFTPGGFLNRQPSLFMPDTAAAQVQGTRAAEFALFVIYSSPVTVACDHPDHYRDQPGTDFLKAVPTVWDETHVLDAAVADYIVEARRKGNDWYVGALTDATPRQLTVPLTFLGSGSYKLHIWKDAKDSNVHAEHIDIDEQTVTAKDKLLLPMVGNGGYVARFQKL